MVNDLTGIDVADVRINLAGVPGGTGSDAEADTISVVASGTAVTVQGLPALVTVSNAEGRQRLDQLTIEGRAGNDVLGATGNLASLARLTLDGGAGDDRIQGSNGADALIGGDGNQGNDRALMGAGDDGHFLVCLKEFGNEVDADSPLARTLQHSATGNLFLDRP